MNDPVKLYDADNGAEAELIREDLEAHGIEAMVDNTPSPLDGLTAMGQGTPVFVSRDDYDKASDMLDRFLKHQKDDDE
jgi:hypothetical protein